jgi:hypothetical protein
MKSNSQAYGEWLDGKDRQWLLTAVRSFFAFPVRYVKRCARIMWKIVTI